MKIISATFLDSGLQKDRCFFLTNCPPIHHLWWMGGFVFLEKYEKRRAAYLAQLSSITVQDECTQPRPRGTLIADQRRACAARPRGNIQGNGWRLRRSGHAEFSLPRGRGGSAASHFNSTDFHVTHRFFVSFPVRPALLPYGKRGFRAAIYKIARPQPPAAALWLQESTVLFLVLLYILCQ